jgi:hypothetical protein
LPKASAEVTLIGKDGKNFKTAEAAGWPEQLCATLSETLINKYLSPSEDKILKMGGPRGDGVRDGGQYHEGDRQRAHQDGQAVPGEGDRQRVHHDEKSVPAELPVQRGHRDGKSVPAELPVQSGVGRKRPRLAGTRRRITKEEMSKIRRGEALGDDLAYVGRTLQMIDGVSQRSAWANPYKVGKDGSRTEVVDKFKADLLERKVDGRIPGLRTLAGKTLLCHCKDVDGVPRRRAAGELGR